MEEKLIIDDTRKEKIFLICSALERGDSPPKLALSLKNFITKVLIDKHPELYKLISKKHIPSASSLRRLLKPGEQGYLMLMHHPYLEKILDLYIEINKEIWQQVSIPPLQPVNPMSATVATPPPFSQQALLELSHRASTICSYPECNRLTSGPSMANPVKAYYLGEACLIRGAKPGDPRYDPKAPHTTDDIENGIWLCTYHAQMVNQHDGIDYPAPLLQDWKSAHEQLMHACMEGKKRIFFALNQEDDQSAHATRILAFFNAQQLLFDPWGTAPHEHLVTVVKNIGAWLLKENAHILLGSRLQQQVYAIDYACDAFLELAVNSDTARFRYALAAFKKALGMMLNEMATCYKVELPANITTIIPQHTNPVEASI